MPLAEVPEFSDLDLGPEVRNPSFTDLNWPSCVMFVSYVTHRGLLGNRIKSSKSPQNWVNLTLKYSGAQERKSEPVCTWQQVDNPT
jgi:hypothetical protein